MEMLRCDDIKNGQMGFNDYFNDGTNVGHSNWKRHHSSLDESGSVSEISQISFVNDSILTPSSNVSGIFNSSIIKRRTKRKSAPLPVSSSSIKKKYKVRNQINKTARRRLFSQDEYIESITRLESQTIFDFVGKGSFGRVVHGKICNKEVAVKICPRPVCHCIGERNALTLVHENIIKTYRVLEIDEVMAKDVFGTKTMMSLGLTKSSMKCNGIQIVIMEFAGRTTLQHILDDVHALDWHRKDYFIKQIILAINYCHHQSIMHLDIKPSNIVITAEDVCKLIDFGCSTNTSHVHQNLIREAIGTIAYTAPEIFRGMKPTYKSDIYSFGITISHILTGEMPYANMEGHSIIYKVATGQLRPKVAKDSNTHGDKYSKLATCCWDNDPRNRPTASQLVDLIHFNN